MTSLQLGLIAAGVLLVVGVLVYNWLQERRVRRRIREAFSPRDAGATATGVPASGARVEPSLSSSAVGENVRGPDFDAPDDSGYEPPLDVQARIASVVADDAYVPPTPLKPFAERGAAAELHPAEPDPEIESIVNLQPAHPVPAGKLAAGLHARFGQPLRWFGRRGPGLPWQLLKSDTGGDFSEIAACLLLANRSGAATAPLLEAFVRAVSEIGATLPAAVDAPDVAADTARAEALDRICADLDVQVGITLLKTDGALIAGTRLRGVAEASGFRLASGGRFDWIQEDTGSVLYALQNYRSDPFTADTLRATSTPGAVFILDVPQVADPVRVFDQMKNAAKRMAHSLDAVLVDDNRRPLDDTAFASIREQVRSTTEALRGVNIEPGSPRALALFGG